MCRTQQTEDRLWSGKETEYKVTLGTVYAVPCPTKDCDVYLATPIDRTLIPDHINNKVSLLQKFVSLPTIIDQKA